MYFCKEQDCEEKKRDKGELQRDKAPKSGTVPPKSGRLTPMYLVCTIRGLRYQKQNRMEEETEPQT